MSLLRGLEPAMTHEEQVKVTELLTSGDPSKLASAAFVLHQIGDLLSKGILQSARSMEHTKMVDQSFQRMYNTKKSLLQYDKNVRNKLGYNNREERVRQEKAEYDAERKVRSMGLPLPVRMPRHVCIQPFDPDGTPRPQRKILNPKTWSGKPIKPSLTFVDDDWDGTLGEAFTKIQVKKNDGPVRKLVVGENVHIVKELKESPGFDKVVHAAWGEGYQMKLVSNKDNVDLPVRLPRVIICDAMGDAAKLGLHRGDVVTHVNDEPFEGTAEDLNYLIKALYADASSGEELSIVVNAEECIATALQLRSLGSPHV